MLSSSTDGNTGISVRTDSPDQPEVRDRNTDRNWTGSPTSDAVEILVPANDTEIIVFGGESILDVVYTGITFIMGAVPCLRNGDWDSPTGRIRCQAKDIIKLAKEFETSFNTSVGGIFFPSLVYI